MHATTPQPELMWPAATGLEHPAEIERIPLEDRGLPESTYHALVRAAELWPERPAISCLPDAERWERPATRTFAELADDVHRAASVYAGLGVGRARRRRDPVGQLRRDDHRAAGRRGGRDRGADQPGAGRRTTPPSSCACRARR